MRRAFGIVLTMLAFVAFACGGDDNNGGTATPPGAATSTSRPASGSTQTSSAGTPASGALISINQPGARETVKVPFAISGAANVFEGALNVRIVGADGATICERAVQATSGTGTPGNWTTTMAFAPPPEETQMTIRAFDFSARDGAEENVVLREITLSPDPPAIVITDPPCNARISRADGIDAAGTAMVFENALTVELRQLDGTVVQGQNITALGGGDRPEWAALIDLSAVDPGRYDLVAYDASARDGTPENVFSIPVEVVP